MTMYKHKHDGNIQANFENWNGKEIIRVVFISEKWIRENATDWEIMFKLLTLVTQLKK
jgi:hypothetical protein